MAGNTARIITRFILEGTSQGLAQLKGFTQGVRAAAIESAKQSQKAKGGLESVGRAGAKAGAETLTTFKILGREILVTGRTAVVFGTALSAAGKAVTTSFSAVLAVFRALRAAAAATFAGIVAGATSAAGAVKGLLGGLHGEVQGITAKLLKSQVGIVTGSGLPIKINLSQSAVGTLLGAMRSLAQRAVGVFQNVFSTAMRTFNPFGRGMQRTVRMVRRSALFLSAPTVAVGAAVNSGANDMQEQIDSAADTGFDRTRSSQVSSYFTLVGGKAADATAVMRKFTEASREIADKGADSDLARSLQAAGIAFQDLNGNARSGQEIFEDLWDAYRNGPDPLSPATYEAVAAAIARIAGSGRDSETFFRLLNETSGANGAARLNELNASVAKFGTAIGPHQVAGLRAYQVGLGALKSAYEGLKVSFVTNIGPTLGTFFGGVADLLARNRDAITLFARGLVTNAALMVTELTIVATQSKAQFSGYNFRFPWLVTLRDGITWVFDVVKSFFAFVANAAPLAFFAFAKAADDLTPLAVRIGQTLGRAVIWIRNFTASLAELYVFGKVEPGFEWMIKVRNVIKMAWEWGGFLFDQLLKVNKALKDGAGGQFGSWLKEKISGALDYAIALGKAIHSLAKTGSAGSGFEWLDKVGDGFRKAREYADTAYSAVVSFFKAVSGDQEALAANPFVASIREKVLGYIDVLQPLATKVYNFLATSLPPILTIVGNQFKSLLPFYEAFSRYMETGSAHLVKVVESAAKSFNGTPAKDLGKEFEWVGNAVEKFKQLYGGLQSFGRVVIEVAAYIGDLGRVIVQHFVNPTKELAESDKKFAWILKVIDWLGTFKDMVMAISEAIGTLASALTLGYLGPVQAALGLFFGVKLIGWLAGAMTALKSFTAAVALLGSGLPGALARGAAGALPALAASLAGGAGGLVGGPIGAIIGALVGGLGVGRGTKGLRSSLAARYPTVAEEAAVALKKEKDLEAAEKAARKANSAGSAVGKAVASGSGAVGAQAGGAAAGRAVVAEEIAAAGFRVALSTAGSALLRFAGVIGALYTAYEVGDFLADITGLKERVKKLLGAQNPDNSPQARLARAHLTGSSYAESIKDGQSTTNDDQNATPHPFDIPIDMNDGDPEHDRIWIKHLGIKDPDGLKSGEAQLKRYNAMRSYMRGDGYGNFEITPEQRSAMETPGNLAQYYNRRFTADDVRGPDEGEFSLARRRRELEASANQAPPVIDPNALSAAVTRGVKDAITGAPIVVGRKDQVDSLRQGRQASFAQADVVPSGAY